MDPQEDESKLLHLASQGDKKAMGEIYERYVDAVYRFMYYRTRNQAVAEDLTAEVFAQVIQSIHRYEDRGLPFGAWLFSIARARLIDYIRKQKRREILRLDDILPLPNPNQDTSPEQVVDDARFVSLLQPLTDRQREVIILRFVGELNNAEIADVVGSNANAVKQMMFRAIQRLRRALEES